MLRTSIFFFALTTHTAAADTKTNTLFCCLHRQLWSVSVHWLFFSTSSSSSPPQKTNWKQILLDLLSFWLTHISSPSFRYFSLSLHCLSLLARSTLPLTAQRRWFLMTTLFNWGVLYFLSVTPDSHSPHMHTLPHMHTAAASLCITSSFFSFLGCYILTLGKLIDF